MKKFRLYNTLINSAFFLWLIKLFLTKKNTFYGAWIDFDIIKKYYREDENFNHFVFQQMIKNGKKYNDNYELVAYAMNHKNEVINSEPIFTRKLNDRPYRGNKQINFANIVLTKTHLDYLYIKPESKGELRLYPLAYLDTNYVSYSAETKNSPVRSVVLNPCPPAIPS